MKGKTLKYIVLLATVSISGVLLIQFLFLRSSFNFTEKQFRESASVALKEVAWQLMLETGHEFEYDSIAPIEIISNKSFLVNVDEVFDYESLKQNLITELKKHEIRADFEFAIFNPVTGKMEEGTLINTKLEEKPSEFHFPTNEEYINYFAIHFPNRSTYFNSQLSIWYFFTGLLLLVVIFFGYTMSVIIRQRQLSEIQKNFINNLTHELKTPISSIALSANVLTDKTILETPKRLFEYANIIRDQNERLAKNVEKVLNLASLEKNRIRLKLEPIRLNEFLLETTNHFKHSDFGSKASVNACFTCKEKEFVADKFHFANLILNILENAVKYCEKSPEIEIEVKKRGKQTIIAFKDNGIGIAKEHRKNIFKKFYRVPTGNVHNVKGFGLGLDYVQKIVKAHGWKIWVSENQPNGSIFTLLISNKE